MRQNSVKTNAMLGYVYPREELPSWRLALSSKLGSAGGSACSREVRKGQQHARCERGVDVEGARGKRKGCMHANVTLASDTRRRCVRGRDPAAANQAQAHSQMTMHVAQLGLWTART
jgi:hypothetical protein